MSAGIDLTKADYVSCMFFAGGEDGDVMGCVYRVAGEEELTLKYRVRTYVDDRAWESEDRKSWFSCKSPMDDEARLVEASRRMVGAVAERFDLPEVSFGEFGGSVEKATEWLMKQSFASGRTDHERHVERGQN